MNLRKLITCGILCPAILILSMINCSSTPSDKPVTPSEEQQEVIIPAPLRPGDKVAIVTPAGPIDGKIINAAADLLRSRGYEPVIYPHAYGRLGYYSGTADERYADLSAALTDPSIKAVLCSRGGYGAVHLLERLNTLPLRDNPKWLIGFSDISALHALLSAHGIASIHGPMAKGISENPNGEDTRALFDILEGKMPSYTFAPATYNQCGTATGRLVGGNVAVLAGLLDTPYDIFDRGTIIFLEDVSEPIYKIERILYQLQLAGILDRAAGILIGEFTDYKPDSVHPSMEEMIHSILSRYDIPVAYNVPFGHGTRITPFVEGATVTLTVTPTTVTLAPAQ